MVVWVADGTIITGCNSISESNDKVVTIPSIYTQIVDGTEESSPLDSLKNVITTLNFETNSEIHTIGRYVFCNFKQLGKVDVSNCLKLENIMEAAFYSSGLTSVIFPQNCKLKKLSQGSFAYTNIVSFDIPSSVTVIDNHNDKYKPPCLIEDMSC